MAIEKIKMYGHNVFAVETIGAGHDMYRQLREGLTKAHVYGTRIKPISHHASNKEKRIESLQPLCENGTLKFSRNSSLLFEQMEQFPGGQFDDLPDALAGAVSLVGGVGRRKTYSKKPKGA
jgi:predicted phage terminase large subunit-like protein